MSIERVIESIDLEPAELRAYLIREVDEFLSAEEASHQEEEFADVLFALRALGWARSKRHLPLEPALYECKVRNRLRQYAALTRHPPRYEDDRISQMEVGVLHFAFGQFAGPWQQFDPLRNGTVAEIHLLTDAPFQRPDRFTNHCIVTFDSNAGIEYDILYASSDPAAGNTIRCRIPDFMYARAKRDLAFADFAEFISLQVLAGLDGLRFAPGAIAHFHSWETGFLMACEEFQSFVERFKTIFSPYLTVGRLQALVEKDRGAEWTMTTEELTVAAGYERRLTASCMRVVLESARDYEFYRDWVHPDRLEVRSFASERIASYPSDPVEGGMLRFIAGGRPVREKGFVELCREFARVRDWAGAEGLEVSLAILCRERRADKGAAYIAEIEAAVAELGLGEQVTIEPKVSLDQLRQRISNSTALIVPSIFDPFSLMPTYAVDVRRPAFVSCHAGVSENVKSRNFTFDPLRPGELAEAIERWYTDPMVFEYQARFPSYRELYLSPETPEPWV